jgi:hypothetical protein
MTALAQVEATARAHQDGCSARTLYARALDPEASLPGAALGSEIRGALRAAANEVAGEGVGALRHEASAWAAEETDRFRALLAATDDADTRDVLARRAALGCAPLGLVLGAWLQWLTSPGNADQDVTLRVLKVYSTDVGVGHPRASRGSAYLELLSHLKLADHAVPAATLPLDQRIPDAAFRLPAVLLAASRRPEELRAELLGADLCLRTVGLPPGLAVVRDVHPSAADWEALDLGRPRLDGAQPGAEAMLEAAEALVEAGGDDDRERVVLGFAWALDSLRRWSAGLHSDLAAALDPVYEMAELLRLRAREGAVYHHDFKLEGRALSEWLQEARTDPGPLLAVLARSRLLKPGRAGASALVGNLIGERGPMFRVFSSSDVEVIRRWIDSLPADRDDDGDARPTSTTAASPSPPLVLTSLDTGLEEGHTPGDVREAYHLLQTRQDTRALRRFALAYAHGWLQRSHRGIDLGDMPLPATWGRVGLRPWLQEMHDRHGQEFEDGREVPVPSREDLIGSTVQLAPLTLIDGSWLQGFTDYGHASSEIGHFLFETFWDELGNGELRLNHPLLYREVLDEMDVHLPPTASPEFVRWPGFGDASFELPVYWLSIGRFPQTFTPEVLGLNLAMELSGVGGTYRRAHIALRKYGFSTRFVDIHNTIDNVATGHSAWAADAVDTYMTAIPSTHSDRDRAATWDRIRTGYRSLNPPSGFWARLAGRRAQRAWSLRKEPSRG